MTILTSTSELDALCRDLSSHDYITIDTEFVREKTYFPKLCLIQLCAPGLDPVAIDPLSDQLDLEPLRKLLSDPEIKKVFHAGRQDLEIFYHLFSELPHPVFDTQIAAMVCGYGDSAGYQKLVQDICNVTLDKAHQFTDWAYRPLSDNQLAYALDDVTYLRDIYEKLSTRLKEEGREKWLDEEMDILTNPQTYEIIPEDCWQRLKLKNTKPPTLAAARALAAWREREAIKKDLPRPWILRDDTLVDLAQRRPKDIKDLKRIRNFPVKNEDSPLIRDVLRILEDSRKVDKANAPDKPEKSKFDPDTAPTFEMLKMLLRITAAENDVAGRIIASQDDLKILSNKGEKADLKLLRGWRYEVFGKRALDLINGKVGIGLRNGRMALTDLD